MDKTGRIRRILTIIVMAGVFIPLGWQLAEHLDPTKAVAPKKETWKIESCKRMQIVRHYEDEKFIEADLRCVNSMLPALVDGIAEKDPTISVPSTFVWKKPVQAAIPADDGNQQQGEQP